MQKSLAILAAFLAQQTSSPNSVEITKFPPVSVTRDWVDRGVWIFSGLLVVVGFLQVWLLWRTLGAIKRQADSMDTQSTETKESNSTAIAIAKKSADAAKESADAAKTSADIAAGISIPTLVVDEFGTGDVGAAGAEAFFQYPKIKITVKNYGQTPAFLKWWCLCFRCEDLPEFPIYDGPACGLVLDKIVVQSGATYTLPDLFLHRQAFSAEEIRAIVSREKPFHAYGYICYGDIFGSPLRRFKFCETVLNIFDGETICDWHEGLAPSAYTGTEKFPTREPTKQGPDEVKPDKTQN